MTYKRYERKARAGKADAKADVEAAIKAHNEGTTVEVMAAEAEADRPGGVQLVHFERARAELAKAATLDEVKDIRDKAEALRLYLRQQSGGLEMQNAAAVLKLRAERRAGEILRDMDKNEGALMQGKALSPRSQAGTAAPPTLAELGIEKTQAHRWQAAAGPAKSCEIWTRTRGRQSRGQTGARRGCRVQPRHRRPWLSWGGPRPWQKDLKILTAT